MYAYRAPERLRRSDVESRTETFGASLGDLERELSATPLGDHALDLTGANTHVFPPADWALPVFTAAAGGNGATYTPYRGDAGVRSKVAANLDRLLGIEIDPGRQLILTPGTQSALFAGLSALIDPGDLVVIPDPDYMLDERIVRYLGGEVRNVALHYNEDGEGVLHEAELDKCMRNASVLLLSNPNNPTGAVYTPSALSAIAQAAARHDVFVIIDELYCRLVYDGSSYDHLIAIPGMPERCLTLVGPSKTESMSGFRIGAAVGPPDVVDRMEDVLCLSAMRAPAYAQHLLGHWIAEDDSLVRDRISAYAALRDVAVKHFRAIPGIGCARSKGTSYVFPDVSALGIDDRDLALTLRSEAGVVINPGYQFGSRGAGHFRVCIAQDEAELRSALVRISNTLDRHARLRGS